MKKFLSILLVLSLVLCSCKAQPLAVTQPPSSDIVINPITCAEFADVLANSLAIELSAYNKNPEDINQGFNWLLELEIVEKTDEFTNITISKTQEIFNKLLERNFFETDFNILNNVSETALITKEDAERFALDFKQALKDANAKFKLGTKYKSFLDASVIKVDPVLQNPPRYEIEDDIEFVKFLNNMPIEKVAYAGAVESWNEMPEFDEEYGIERLCHIIVSLDNQNTVIFVDKDLQTIVYNNYAYTIQKGYLDIIKDYVDNAK